LVVHHHAADPSVLQQQSGDLALKVHLATGFHYAVAHGTDDVWEQVGTDVGMGVDEDVLRGSVGDQCTVYFRHRSSLFGPRVEFTVRKGAGPAFSKTIIGIFDHSALTEDGCEIKSTRRNILATFDHDRLHAAFNAAQSGKQPGGPAADDQDLFGTGG